MVYVHNGIVEVRGPLEAFRPNMWSRNGIPIDEEILELDIGGVSVTCYVDDILIFMDEANA